MCFLIKGIFLENPVFGTPIDIGNLQKFQINLNQFFENVVRGTLLK